MKEIILGTVDPGAISFDPDKPTEQTEKLSWELRKILYQMSVQGFKLTQPEPNDDLGLYPAEKAIEQAIYAMASIPQVISVYDKEVFRQDVLVTEPL